MKIIKVYTTEPCRQCLIAKELLERHEIPYEEISLSKDPEGRRTLTDRTGHFTFPQVIVGEKLIGGLSELLQLDEDGKIENLLAAA